MEYTRTKVPSPKKRRLTEISVLGWFSALICWNVSTCASTLTGSSTLTKHCEELWHKCISFLPFTCAEYKLAYFVVGGYLALYNILYRKLFWYHIIKNPVIRLSFTSKTWIQSIFYRYILPIMDMFTWRDRSIFLELRRTHINFFWEKNITTAWFRDISTKHHRGFFGIKDQNIWLTVVQVITLWSPSMTQYETLETTLFPWSSTGWLLNTMT